MRLPFIIAAFLIYVGVAQAQNIPAPLTPYVSDYANLIDPETEARITEELTAVRNDLDLEVAVVTIESRHEYGDTESIEAFSTAWFNQWGIGSKARNDGVLIIVARSDREMRVELGSSYGPIYDDRMGLVIQHHFLPYFQGDEYSAGIESGTYEAIKRLQPTYAISEPNSLDRPSLWESFKRSPIWRFMEDKLGFLVFILIGGFVFLESSFRTMLVGLKRCPNCNQRQLHRRSTVEKQATRHERGEELMETFCTSCDFNSIEHRSIPMLRDETRHSSSGSSGFGGGSSSGGGASGRW